MIGHLTRNDGGWHYIEDQFKNHTLLYEANFTHCNVLHTGEQYDK